MPLAVKVLVAAPGALPPDHAYVLPAVLAAVRVTEAHAVVVPVITGVAGGVLTVTLAEAVAVPQELVTVTV